MSVNCVDLLLSLLITSCEWFNFDWTMCNFSVKAIVSCLLVRSSKANCFFFSFLQFCHLFFKSLVLCHHIMLEIMHLIVGSLACIHPPINTFIVTSNIFDEILIYSYTNENLHVKSPLSSKAFASLLYVTAIVLGCFLFLFCVLAQLENMWPNPLNSFHRIIFFVSPPSTFFC